MGKFAEKMQKTLHNFSIIIFIVILVALYFSAGIMAQMSFYEDCSEYGAYVTFDGTLIACEPEFME